MSKNKGNLRISSKWVQISMLHPHYNEQICGCNNMVEDLENECISSKYCIFEVHLKSFTGMKFKGKVPWTTFIWWQSDCDHHYRWFFINPNQTVLFDLECFHFLLCTIVIEYDRVDL